MDILYACKCKCFRNTGHTNIWNTIVKLKHVVFFLMFCDTLLQSKIIIFSGVEINFAPQGCPTVHSFTKTCNYISSGYETIIQGSIHREDAKSDSIRTSVRASLPSQHTLDIQILLKMVPITSHVEVL
jgi:hypothetical protein